MGQTLQMTFAFPDGEFAFTPKAVVGIVGNAVHESVRGPVRPIVYVPMAQEPLQSIFVAGIFIAVRSEDATPGRLSRSVAATLASVDPDVRVSFLTGTGIVGFALARDRLVARLAAFAGLLAVLLTALGVGGVTAYHATRRRPELAVRVALGSTRGRLVGLVLSRVLGRVVAGVVVGLAIRLLDVTAGGVDAVRHRAPRPRRLRRRRRSLITVVGLLAGWVPAYRASRLHPARALTETRS